MPRGVGIAAAATCLCAFLLAAPAGAATVSPPSKDFGDQTQGAASDSSSFTLMTSFTVCTDPASPPPCISLATSNVDTTALGGGPGTTTTVGDFVIHNVSCQNPEMSPFVEFASATCAFDVRFLPTTTGTLSKTLSFSDSSGPTATLSLTGTGLAPPPTPASTPTPTTTAPKKKKCKRKHRVASSAKKCKKKRR
jgi:hypothetical protein